MRLTKLTEMHIDQLLDVFLDPEAAKKQLALYKQARDEANAVIDAANEHQLALDTYSKQLSDLDHSFDPKRQELEQKQAELDAAKSAVSQREAAVAASEAT